MISQSPFIVDNFPYARCCVVANGKEVCQKVLEGPSTRMDNELKTFPQHPQHFYSVYERNAKRDACLGNLYFLFGVGLTKGPANNNFPI